MDLTHSYEKLNSGVTLVTGGAGFIGSHIIDKLVSNNIETKILDNLSNGNLENLSKSKDSKYFHLEKSDLKDVQSSTKIFRDVKSVFHIAAYPEVRTGFDKPEISYKENIENTFFLLEKIRKSNVERIVFASSSTVYGEPNQIPTPEDYGPLFPISPYGSSKLACEAMISSYCHTYGIDGLFFRFANIVGSRSNHGVIGDFIKKLNKDNTKLEVLGDGKQSKSYLHVSDCVESFLFCISKQEKKTEIYNIGNDDVTDVLELAQIVCNCMDLKNVKINTTGGIGGRGWVGDVKQMQLDISKLKNLGWRPKLTSSASVELAANELLKESI